MPTHYLAITERVIIMIKEFQREYRWLSNFAPCSVVFEGEIYDSVENAYQASKTLNPVERTWFQGITAGQAKRMSRKITIRDDWDTVKLENMRWLLSQKYLTPKYKKLLLKTKGRHIQEGNRWGDKFWGVCLKSGDGQNNLGKLIMEIRSQL